MTRRKPPGVSFETWIERQIRTAREQGLFDDLPGAGEPLRDLGTARDPLWWAKSLVDREKLSVLPPALEMRSRVEQALEKLEQIPREGDVRALVQELNQQIRRLNRLAHEGPPTRQAVLDEDDVVADWRRRRESSQGQPGTGAGS
jgi:hypothetical protein